MVQKKSVRKNLRKSNKKNKKKMDGFGFSCNVDNLAEII